MNTWRKEEEWCNGKEGESSSEEVKSGPDNVWGWGEGGSGWTDDRGLEGEWAKSHS
jgi:hypothetical protein